MNKLVIIGNGFDLAHGMKTSYSDFVLWYVNKIFKRRNSPKDEDLIEIKSNLTYEEFESLSQVKERHHISNFELILKDDFFKSVYDNACEKRWVDIEREYYKQLLKLSNNDEVVKLNKSLDAIKIELAEYLSQLKPADCNNEIGQHLYSLKSDSDSNYKNLYVLNFNYTSNIEKYIGEKQVEEKLLNYIHGKLADKDNPIIFGYGDETDENYEKIEKLNDNEFLKHMKSFAYLQTPNYKNLFEFLDKKDEPFEVHIMGHSCGLSDRLLFTHILEHPNLHSVKIYYYDKGNGQNDFFEKTQELSRYFRKDEKHKMRKVFVPFNESVPLLKYKSNEN